MPNDPFATATAAPSDPFAQPQKKDPFAQQTQQPHPTPTAGPGPSAPHGGPTPISQGIKYAGTALSTIAGHQDLPYILWNAYQRDIDEGHAPDSLVPNPAEIVRLLKKPTSYTAEAMHLWRTDPSFAMDLYGEGSPQQLQYEAQHGKGFNQRFSQARLDKPWLNAIVTAVSELGNPLSIVEGGVAGKAAGAISHLPTVAKTAQKVAKVVGLGSPLSSIAERGGNEAVSWMNSMLHEVTAPEKFLGYEKTSPKVQKIFGPSKEFPMGLTPDEQEEVFNIVAHGNTVRPSVPGLSPEQQHNLLQRAQEMRSDISAITGSKKTYGLIKPQQVRQDFVPMGGAYEFEPWSIQQEMRGAGRPGVRRTEAKQKTFQSPAEARAAGFNPFQQHIPATQYANWRHVQLQRIGFEHAMSRAPKSLKLQPRKGLRAQLKLNNMTMNVGGRDLEYRLPSGVDQRNLASPQLRKGAIAPELLDTFLSNDKLKKYLGAGNAIVPGAESNFFQRLVALSRNMIITNPIYHPVRNVASNDVRMRGLAGLPGGPEAGGMITAPLKALHNQAVTIAGRYVPRAQALKFGMKAQEYSKWLDRALKAGASGEFGEPTGSALGGERMRVLTTPAAKGAKGWVQRLDRAFTRYGEFNREQVFGSPGEESFAVSLFKDAVTKGHMSDADAGALVRQAYHDYFNLDPHSPWSYIDLFMPWRKANTKFYINTLLNKPQYITSETHAIRNVNQQTNPDDDETSMPYARPDFQVRDVGGLPVTISDPARDITSLANMAGSAAKGNMGEALQQGYSWATASMNPVARLVGKQIPATASAVFSPDVQGPELGNPDLLLNPKAPGPAQVVQALKSVAGSFLPVPMLGYVARDIAQRGWKPEDVKKAAVLMSTVGYAGNAPTTASEKFRVARAKQTYKKAYERYRYGDHDPEALSDAWNTYMQTLQDIGVIGN